MSDMLRITGIASGMDTDTTVKKLIQTEQIKVDQANQEKQYLEWQKEDYREVANVLRGFQEEYFDLTKPESNLRSASTFEMFAASSKIGEISTSAVSIVTSSESLISNFKINNVTQLATKDKYTSGDVVSSITTGVIDYTAINTQVTSNNNLSFTFDGVDKTISLDQSGYGSLAAFATDISSKLQLAYNNVEIKAEISGSTLEFNIYDSTGVDLESGHALTIGSENSSLLDLMSLSAGDTDTLDASETLSAAFNISGERTFEINGTSFTFDTSKKISEVLTEVNESNAGVTMSYSSFSDKFTLESNTEGSEGVIALTDEDGLLAAFKLQDGSQTYEEALGAKFEIDGVSTSRSTNTFEYSGVSITLNDVSADAIDVNVAADTTAAKDLIVKFVASYNDLITKINDMISSDKNYDYDPLTSEQKKDMTDDDIEAWQTLARKGTLRNDVSLEKITREMRTALYESVEGMDISLYDIGIQTSTNYKEQGKLVVDETKLDAALKENPNKIIELITKQSSTSYTSFSQRSTRKSENGVAHRIYDILQDNIRITRDTNGNKGYLIEKAGNAEGVDATSDMAKKLIQMDEKIDALLQMLGDREEKYYAQFSAMESAMSRLQSQGDALISQLG